MSKKLVRSMHWFVLAPLGVVCLVFALYHLDPYDYGSGSGELGNSLLYAFLYFLALIFGFVGWILSMVLLVKERRARTRQSAYAVFYLIIGAVGFGWAYYLMQAS